MGSSAGYEEQRVDVFQYFTRSCFRAFDDRADGFYTVYQKVFENIAEEELRVTAFNASDDDQSTTDEDADCKGEINARTYPTFGRSDSPYIEVVAPFYRFWEMFRTRKSYTWLEKYDIRCAESRPERRAMEAENRRIRNAARKKRNEEIRELVAFVKKRDKRVAAERERLQLANQEVQARNQQMAKQARLRFQKFRKPRILYFQSTCTQDQKGHPSEESDVENLYCLACDKVFASVKSKENHETSKKHRKQAEILRQILLADEEAATTATDHHGDEPENGRTSDVQSSSIEDTGPVVEVKLTKRAKKAQRKRERETEKQDAARATSENPEASVPVQASAPSALPEKARKSTTKCTENRPPSLDQKGHPSEESDVENLYCLACDKVFASVKSKENHETSKKHRKQAEILRQILLADEEAATTATDHHGDEPENGRTSDVQSSSIEDTGPVVEVKLTKRAKKAQRKRERETEKQDAARATSENPEASVPVQASAPSALPEKARKSTTKCTENRPPSLVCEVCTTEFPSRNQLFAHLKSTGHAVVKRPVNSVSRLKTKNKPKH
ncbi:hypothetical protein AHF37_06957 [Paragonimus kellicotti]|nr:hypothetical protein AHF37_06957 [Paragonimus kellicotti]